MKMKAPKNSSGGLKVDALTTYEPDRAGVVDVAHEHVELAKGHGYVEYNEAALSLEELIGRARLYDPSVPSAAEMREQLMRHIEQQRSELRAKGLPLPEELDGEVENAPELTAAELAAQRKTVFLEAVADAKSKQALRDLGALNGVDLVNVEDKMGSLVTALTLHADKPDVLLKVEAGK